MVRSRAALGLDLESVGFLHESLPPPYSRGLAFKPSYIPFLAAPHRHGSGDNPFVGKTSPNKITSQITEPSIPTCHDDALHGLPGLSGGRIDRVVSVFPRVARSHLPYYGEMLSVELTGGDAICYLRARNQRGIMPICIANTLPGKMNSTQIGTGDQNYVKNRG